MKSELETQDIESFSDAVAKKVVDQLKRMMQGQGAGLDDLLSPMVEMVETGDKKGSPENPETLVLSQLRGLDLNQRPSGYEPDELPDCSTPLVK